MGKVCTKCGEEKETSDFYLKKSRNSYEASCKKCFIEHTRQYKKDNPSKAKDTQLRWRYGIGFETYLEMLKRQEYRCKICSTHVDNIIDYRLVVDHCHVTENVRGLLCHACNKMLGFAKDDLKILESAIHYLEECLGTTEE